MKRAEPGTQQSKQDSRKDTASGLREPRRWTEDEDTILRRETQAQFERNDSVRDWNAIATKLPGRTNKDCRKRWTKVSKDVNKGSWSAAEDSRLLSAVAKHGQSWTRVASIVGTRHADQCAKRWLHGLDPNLDHSEWSTEDDKRLLACVERHGRNWRLIGKKGFAHRSPTNLKNRYTIITGYGQGRAPSSPPRSRSSSGLPQILQGDQSKGPSTADRNDDVVMDMDHEEQDSPSSGSLAWQHVHVTDSEAAVRNGSKTHSDSERGAELVYNSDAAQVSISSWAFDAGEDVSAPVFMPGVEGDHDHAFDASQPPLDPNLFIDMSWTEESGNEHPSKGAAVNPSAGDTLSLVQAPDSVPGSWNFDTIEATTSPQAPLSGIEPSNSHIFDSTHPPLDPKVFGEMPSQANDNPLRDVSQAGKASHVRGIPDFHGADGTFGSALSRPNTTPVSNSSSRPPSHRGSKTILVMEGVQIDTLRTITDILYKDKVKLRMEMSHEGDDE